MKDQKEFLKALNLPEDVIENVSKVLAGEEVEGFDINEAITNYKEVQASLAISSKSDEIKKQAHLDSLTTQSKQARQQAKSLVEAGLLDKDLVEKASPKEVIAMAAAKTLELAESVKTFKSTDTEGAIEKLKEDLRLANIAVQKEREASEQKIEAFKDAQQRQAEALEAAKEFEVVFEDVRNTKEWSSDIGDTNCKTILKANASDVKFLKVENRLMVYKEDGVSQVPKPDRSGFFEDAKDWMLFYQKKLGLAKQNANQGNPKKVTITVGGKEQPVDMGGFKALKKALNN